MILLPRLALTALVLSAVTASGEHGAPPGEPPKAPPADWRHFVHVRSVVVEEGHPLYAELGGLHEIYANRKALPVLQAGASAYPDGAVLVLDLHQVVRADHAVVPGSRRLLAVMVRNSVRYAATGGWGYQAWAGGDPAKPQVTDMQGQCAVCHAQAAERGGVFSRWQD